MNLWIWFPLVSAFVGGVTNWLAVILTLHPARPTGWGPLRWQGVLPRKAGRLVFRFTERLGREGVDVKALFAQVDPDLVAAHAEAELGTRAEELIEQSLRAVNPELWPRLRAPVRAQWIAKLRPTLPRVLAQVLRTVQKDAERYVHLPQLASDQVGARPEILSEIFWTTGRVEFRFIEWSGALIGCAMGVALALVWQSWPSAWTSIAGGAVVGGLTNWLAITMIFAPQQPRRIGPWKLQGIVYRRQKDAVQQLGMLVLDRVLTFGALMSHMAAREETLFRLIREAVRTELDRTAGGSALLVAMALGADSTEAAVDAMARSIAANSPAYFGDMPLPARTRDALGTELRRHLEGLPPDVYGALMRSAVAEDEPLLIASGVVLGALFGLIPPI